jgi:hypothetical protein
MELEQGRQWFGGSETLWLVGQAISYLNGAEPSDERNYQHTIALLRDHKAGTGTLTQLAHGTAVDPTLRWNILHLLGDAGDASSTKYLVKAALERLPERQSEGCEGPYDTELLNRTMAVHAIAALSHRHEDAAQGLFRIIEAKPDRAVLIEAVRAAVDLGQRERVQAALKEEDRWILDIKRAGYREINADPERTDGKEVGFVPPRHRSQHTAPHASGCGCGTKED